MPTKKKNNKKTDTRKILFIIILGLFFVITISILEGFPEAFVHMIEHLKADFAEWAIHLYILGIILVFYGLFLVSKRKV